VCDTVLTQSRSVPARSRNLRGTLGVSNLSVHEYRPAPIDLDPVSCDNSPVSNALNL
jgi:hypothetical protein